jgi:hypothetical protein
MNIFHIKSIINIIAIAKILNLDDSSLKDVAYYPYDLVHYKK